MESANILVCEDEFIIAEDIGRCLEGFGYKVTGIAGNAGDALRVAENTKPDLALMDIRLNGELSGIEVAEILRERFNIPVIYLTAFADTATLEKAKKTEPLGYLTKPFQDRELRSAIEVGLYRHKRQLELREEMEKSRAALQRERNQSNVANEIVELQRQLMEVQKMEAIRSMAGGIAHHVNNTLCAIEGTLQYLFQYMCETGVMGTSQKHLVDGALQKCDRTAWMIKHLLWFAEQAQNSSEEVSISKLMLGALEDVSHMMKSEIDVATYFSPGPLTISVDKRRVKQVITDLLLNAQDAMPSGGVITMSSYLEYQEVPERFNQIASPGWYVVAKIKDTGSGMSEETLKRAFEPFFTTKPLGEGIGLGLSLTYGVMQSHGGWVTLQSEIGKGTSVSLYFPQQQKAILSDPETKITGAPRGSVMVVDDEPVVGEVIGERLSRAGFQAHVFTEPHEALAWYRENSGKVDLIFLDMKMPKIDGRGCFSEIRKITPDARVAVFSGYTEREITEQMLNDGVLNFFGKPFNWAEVQKWIEDTLNLPELPMRQSAISTHMDR